MNRDDLALRLDCPACAARAGEWCRTYRPYTHAPGRRAAMLHQRRVQPVQDLTFNAMQEGVSMGYQMAAGAIRGRVGDAVWAADVPTDLDELADWLYARSEEVLSRVRPV